MTGQTLAEKIFSRACGKSVRAGDIVFPEPDLVTTHDWYVVNFADVLEQLGVNRLHAPQKVLIATDHEPVALSPLAAARQRKVRGIVDRLGIKNFFDVGRGGHGHVFPMEMGFIRPGMLVVAYDIHATNYGALGCLAVPVVTEITEVLACGSVWLKVPRTVRVELTGRRAPGTTMRDVAQRLIATLRAEDIDYSVVEFFGPALRDIDFAGRQVLCNTPIELGAKSAIVEPDASTLDYLATRTREPVELLRSDGDAHFHQRVTFDLDVVEPQVAVPPTPDQVVGISAVAGRKIHHAFVGSCAAAGLTDLADAASVLAHRRVSPGVRLYITPSTQNVLLEAIAAGYVKTFVEAGAVMTAPGCGVCAGGKIAPLADGEVSINTGTRNDFGRLGSTHSEIYLASAATVAASAVTGVITDPRELL